MTRKLIPVARRIGGDGNDNTLRLRWNYALSLYNDPSATPDDLREAINTLEEIEPTARRVLGGAHPVTTVIEKSVRNARAALRARESWCPSNGFVLAVVVAVIAWVWRG